MDSINAYGSDSSDNGSGDERSSPIHAQPVVRKYVVDTAPDVGGRLPSSNELAGYVHPDQKEITYNIPYAVLSQPLVGPLDTEGSISSKSRSLASGRAEAQAVDETMFRQQERSFRQSGVAYDPSIGAENRTVSTQEGGDARRRNNCGLRRRKRGDASVLDGENAYLGPWAGYEGETKGQVAGPSAEQLAEYEKRMAEYTGDQPPSQGAQPTGPARKSTKHAYVEGQDERTIFHGKAECDYQGRTYMHVPMELRQGEVGDQHCFVPKRMVKEWKAHTGGVSAIRFIPDSGHLLLSSGMDGLVKIYDTHSSLTHLRTYIGHSKAVRDISFAPDGQSFLSSSYDKYTKLWDTETGKCRQRFSAGGKIPYVARFYPEDPNIFLVGQGDKKIVQWDIRSNEVVQEYDQHLGAINSLTFFDSNRRFISTSDDKTMRVWEFGIPVVIKLVADPSMHSVPAVALHPNEKWFAGQSMDNRIVVYSAGERIKPHRRKEFSGHLTAGYACQPSFSPDGKILTSGDAEGQVWCWDWQSARVLGKWKAHDKVAIGSAWHPRETSKVATCSWDGTIKYWD
ncbi:WD40 repeat-like protein [Martensiomyces pterosporus]|nr:WD40 repeat-like protein [Martensiomyces pterosporus]